MNKEEALRVLHSVLMHYRERPYPELTRLIGRQETFEITAVSGSRYQIEIEAFWDDKANGNVRALGSINDCGTRAYLPLCRDFIMTPNGSFVGE